MTTGLLPPRVIVVADSTIFYRRDAHTSDQIIDPANTMGYEYAAPISEVKMTEDYSALVGRKVELRGRSGMGTAERWKYGIKMPTFLEEFQQLREEEGDTEAVVFFVGGWNDSRYWDDVTGFDEALAQRYRQINDLTRGTKWRCFRQNLASFYQHPGTKKGAEMPEFAQTFENFEVTGKRGEPIEEEVRAKFVPMEAALKGLLPDFEVLNWKWDPRVDPPVYSWGCYQTIHEDLYHPNYPLTGIWKPLKKVI